MIVEEKTLSSEKIYNGKIINVRVDTVELPEHKYQKREIVEHSGGVTIAAYTENKKILLVKQFRKPAEEVLWELPAGKLEFGEDPKTCAIRELKEETGYEALNVKHLNSFYTSPGFCTEIIHLFMATEMTKGEVNLDDGEYVEFFEIDMQEAINMIKTGQIKDSKTITGILLLKELI